MKKTLLIIPLFFLGVCCSSQRKENVDLVEFEGFLGVEKSNALNNALESFDHFLELNFGNLNTRLERTEAFLKRVNTDINIDTTWKLNTVRNIKILNEWEVSGLRRDMWLYSDENYDTNYNIEEILNPNSEEPDSLHDLGEVAFDFDEDEIVIPSHHIDTTGFAKQEKEREVRFKNSLWYNREGKFLYGLAKYSSMDTLVQNYVSAKYAARNISPVIVAGALLEQTKDFEDPFLRRIVVSEFYFFIMRWDIKRNE